LPGRTSAETAQWLRENGEVVAHEASGVVHRLRTTP